MSNKKWDDKALGSTPVIIVESDSVSGSKQIGSNRTASVEVIIKPHTKNILIPIEEFSGFMSMEELQSYREFMLQQFPDLFDVHGLQNDKASEVPFLALTKSARIFANLLETNIKLQEKQDKERILN